MEAKQKAKELFDKMSEWQSLLFKTDCPSLSHEYIKQCALIAVDEIINELKMRNCTIKY